MSVGLEKLRQVMADHLNSRGVPAVTAFPALPRQERREPVAVVSLRGCKMGPSGFQNYLGDRYDPEADRWEERYGRRAELTFGLDLYAPEKGEGERLQAAFDALAGALLPDGPEGLDMMELSCGQTVRDGERRLLKLPVEAVFSTYLSAAADAGGGFTEIELRGVRKV